MGFLYFLRRVNRGIVLAILLVVGLTCYLAIDGMAFEEEREAITQVLSDYIQELEGLMLLPEQYREIGVEVPDDVIEAKMAENNEILSKYFVSAGRNYGLSFSAVSDILSSVLMENQKNGEVVSGFEAVLTRVRNITKHGAGIVTVEAEVRLTRTVTYGARYFNVLSFGWGYGYYDSNDATEEKAFSMTSSVTSFTCEMVKRNGVWVFSDLDYLYESYR